MLSRNGITAIARRGYDLLRANSSQVHSVSPKTTTSTQVVVADDGRTLVCWHPEPHIPYEFSLPLPNEKEPNSSAIKSLNGNDIRDVTHLNDMKETLAREELMKMTHTTKHRWFPRLQKKKAKKTPMERPYL
ncbi:hypothetical protein ONE63_002928 [Megalurothrips usitatus]|uniref:Large ribosomal subunit protein mL42 n=1 Tax=Megalurothrips usitatus TaxID=439358 RepID=A0AAV7X9Y7_9NEOP|nr:hypothetical protein ONE63_002928 [Megalurothrips usitatus]